MLGIARAGVRARGTMAPGGVVTLKIQGTAFADNIGNSEGKVYVALRLFYPNFNEELLGQDLQLVPAGGSATASVTVTKNTAQKGTHIARALAYVWRGGDTWTLEHEVSLDIIVA